MEYILNRSKRKTVAIHITREGTLEVRAPFCVPKADIDSFVDEKKEWISKHLTIKQQQNLKKAGFSIAYGDLIFLQGKAYPVRALEGNRAGFDGICFYMPPDLNAEEIKNTLIQIYKKLGHKILLQKSAYFAKHMGVSPSAIKISNAKTHWGSCSGRNNINFSWRLMMADDKAIDYVVVHELAHIKEHNHSSRFWRIVEAILPDYKERQKALIRLQDRLNGEDW